MKNCPMCASETEFCTEHQKNEKRIFESESDLSHDSQEFRMKLLDARRQDLEER